MTQKDDLISRQDAIDAIERVINTGDKLMSQFKDNTASMLTWTLKRDAMNVVKDTIRSVTPSVIRCNDCKHFHRNLSCVGGHYDGCDEWIDEGCESYVKEDDFCSYAERR